jgi:hypothetical protein
MAWQLEGIVMCYIPCLKTMTMLAVTGVIMDNVFAATPACLVLLATAKSSDRLFKLWDHISEGLAALRMDFANLAYYERPALASGVAVPSMADQDNHWPPLASFQGLQSHWLGMLGAQEDSRCAMTHLAGSSAPINGVVPSYWSALFPKDFMRVADIDPRLVRPCVVTLGCLATVGGGILGLLVVLLFEARNRKIFVVNNAQSFLEAAMRTSPGAPRSTLGESSEAGDGLGPAPAHAYNIEGVVEGFEQEMSWVLHTWFCCLFTAALLVVFLWLEPWVTLGTWFL